MKKYRTMTALTGVLFISLGLLGLVGIKNIQNIFSGLLTLLGIFLIGISKKRTCPFIQFLTRNKKELEFKT